MKCRLAQAMEQLVMDDDLSDSLRERGLQRAAEFSWENTARETLIQITEATNGH